MLSSLHILFLLACVFDPLVFASNFKFELAKKLFKFQIHLFTSTSVANDMLKNFGTFNVLALIKIAQIVQSLQDHANRLFRSVVVLL